ncbi:NAD(+)/NADH kinase [Natrarchaeobius oligotrophus]|uniref:NAD(+)/NADH kinase n=1 Tax=Natrarchaeobius chitinivorans TaxID=1679083 RepID=A0A3N6MX93_NATCH|nr:NAD(+)/NADH kinase [Natrarchaeobius chitinivorans]RQG99626.1 NAD(+)/NADH kinase [Natrarchaeobius chitinivorans]
MNRTAWTPDADPVVGIVTDDPRRKAEATGSTTSTAPTLEPSAALETAIADRDGTLVTGSPEDVLAAEPSLVVAAAERTVAAVAAADLDAAILPLGDVTGIEGIEPAALEAAIEAALAGETAVETRPLLSVETPQGRRERAVFDVTLVTEEPAQISEYTVSSRGDRVARFRADGVVAATPAGSDGYANAVDGPLLSAALEALAVVPIAPFVTRTRRWVLPDDGLTISVERDEDPVVVCVDDRTLERVPAGERVSIAADGSFSTLVASTVDGVETSR